MIAKKNKVWIACQGLVTVLDANDIEGEAIAESKVEQTQYSWQFRMRQINPELVILTADNLLFTVKLVADGKLELN